MTRKRSRTNYKKRSTKTVKKNNPTTWLVIGFLIGLIIPSLFLFKSHSRSDQDTRIVTPIEEDIVVPEKSTPRAHTKKKSNPKSAKYDFYDVLTPDESTSSLNSERRAEDADLALTKFELEIRKFNSFQEADELKARLVLMGFDVSIEKSIRHKTNAYRVIAGPFTSRLKASEVQNRLKENAINSVLVVSQ